MDHEDRLELTLKLEVLKNQDWSSRLSVSREGKLTELKCSKARYIFQQRNTKQYNTTKQRSFHPSSRKQTLPLIFIMLMPRSISYIFILALSKVAAGDPGCSCFEASQLERFTAENINREASCHYDENDNIGIFLQESPAGNGESQGSFVDGFEVSFYYEPTCLVEGDMLIMIDSVEEAEVCAQMIRVRCGQIGIDPRAE